MGNTCLVQRQTSSVGRALWAHQQGDPAMRANVCVCAKEAFGHYSHFKKPGEGETGKVLLLCFIL